MTWRSAAAVIGFLGVVAPAGSTARVSSFPESSPEASAQVSQLDVALFRTRRAADLTLVDGVIEFDPGIAEGGADCAYWLDVEVRDSAGLSIFEDGWERDLECGGEPEPGDEPEAGGRAIRVVDTFRFAVSPGRYSVEVRLGRSGEDAAARTAVYDLESLPVTTPASDLILGRDVGLVDTVAGERWTVMKGEVGIAANPYVVADPERSDLAYYVEAYPSVNDTLTGEVVGTIRQVDGGEVVRSTLGTLPAGEFAVPVAGTLSLAGLPPGDYALEIEVPVGDSVVRRSRGFRMVSSFATAPTARSMMADSLRRYFGGLTDDELERLFDPIEIWIDSEQERRRYGSLTPAEQRRYLITFFLNVASEQTGTGESPLELYLERVRKVNQRFDEAAGERSHAGWRTDRGRIYLLRGEPDERVDRAFPRDSRVPYEIWGYTGGRAYTYLFIDETGFGNYRLVFSNDPREPPLPGWESRVGRGAVLDLERYLGVSVRRP